MIRKIENLLTDNEKILVDARIHPVVYVAPLTLIFFALLGGIFFHWIMFFVIGLVALYPMYNAYIHYTMTHLVLTNFKVLSRQGFLSRDWTQMWFDRIENAYLEEPIVGRALGYSTVVISGVGQGSINIRYVQNGHEFVRRLEKELERTRKKSA